MTNKKAITLLSLISLFMVAVMFFTFAKFSVGEVKEYMSALRTIEVDYDLEGGVAYTYSLDKDNEEEVEDINAVINTLETRLEALGYSTYSVKAIKSPDKDVLDYDIRIEAKGTDSLSSDIGVVMSYGAVEFYGGSSANPTEQILEGINVVKTAKYIGSYVDTDNTTKHQVAITFTNEGYEALIEKINSESSYYLEVRLGDTVLLSGTSAISESYFADKTLGVTSTSEAQAKQMALQISSGGLNYKYNKVDSVDIDSLYGARVAMRVAIAVACIIVLLMVALILCYKGFGIISAISALIFIIAQIWLFVAVPGVVITLDGVFGLLLAIMLCAYSLVLVCNRVKEEYAHSEKTVKAAINKGFSMALIPTLNMHFVAGAISILLLIFASGSLYSFAVTLGIGTIVSFICSTVFTRMFTALILPVAKNKEKFLDMKKEVA